MAGTYRYGDTAPVIMPILTAQGCLVADLLCTSSGNVIRAEDLTYGSDISAPSAPTGTNGSCGYRSPRSLLRPGTSRQPTPRPTANQCRARQRLSRPRQVRASPSRPRRYPRA